jgi:bifunctional non-homologous end joining protein LigD
MSLSLYKKKRSFTNTPEPTGKKTLQKSRPLLFVVQKHDATRLHYDFRLEIRGVLKSWAVPKGPSMNPEDKRLAMLVEDHPFDYKDFEGIIPKGNYGAGTVIVWDNGDYEPADKTGSREEQEKQLLHDFHKGSLRIVLKGKKLKGEFALVRTRGREENAWLLIKKRDKQARAVDITTKDKSVLSHKTLEQVATGKQPKQWISNRDEKGNTKKRTTTPSAGTPAAEAPDYAAIAKEVLKSIKDKRKAAFPKNIKPMLTTLVDKPFDAEGWSYEVKWDGYRALAYRFKNKTEVQSRNNISFRDQFYPVYEALQNWNIHAVVDGEIVAANEKGFSSFQQLQNWRSEADGELFYYVFDILWLYGYDLTGLALAERRAVLKQLIPPDGLVRYSESFETSATEFFEAAKKLGIEGMIAKRNDSEYIPGTRTKDWLKIKSGKRHEAVIGGYTRNEDSTKLFSALLLGVYKNKKLHFIGQAGTGYTDALRKEILEKLKPLETPECPFVEIPIVNKPSRFRPRPPKAAVVWVKPKLVGEVQYQELTDEGVMRHPSFQGLRIDKKATDVIMDLPIPAPEKKAAKNIIEEKMAPAVKPGKQGPERKTLLNPHNESQERNISGHTLKFTNLSKLYWPEEKISKRELLNYYYKIAPYILPYLKDRPQSLNRHPNGIHEQSFYQKNVAGKIPDWLTTHNYTNTSKEGTKRFLVCTDEASLLYMANLGCIEMNPWHSRIQSPDNPDWCVIDLDPDKNTFSQVIEAANTIKKILDAIDVPSWPKTSGSTGIHIYIPLGAAYDYDQSKMLAEIIVNIAHRELSRFTSLERNPAKRKGKIYLDFLQNRPIQTIAAPYSARPRPGATVSAPLHWEEVNKNLAIKNYTLRNMPARIKEQGDIFKGVLGKGIDLKKVIKKAGSVFG